MHHRRYLFCVLLILFCLTNLLLVCPVHADSPAVNYPQTLGKAALLMDASSGRVLYEVNAHERLSPASVTKIMTGLLVVEHGNLSQRITVSEKAATTPESAIWLETGETLTREHLLYALMLNSANDASVALAESVAGSENAFVELMNRRAKELGMGDTHFCNPHGLESTGHYTSAYDLALVSRESMNHAIFRQVVATKTKKIPWAENDYDRLLINKNRLLFRYDDAIGIKNGYTKEAGNCVVGAAQRGSLMLIAVALKSPSVYEDLQQMLDYGFANFNKKSIKKINDLSVEVPVVNGQEKTVLARPKVDLTVAVTTQEESSISYTVHPQDKVIAPVKKGQVLGICKISVAGNEAATVDLMASTSVAEKPPFLTRLKSFSVKVIKFIFQAFLVIFACMCLIRIINLRRRQRKRRQGPYRA